MNRPDGTAGGPPAPRRPAGLVKIPAAVLVVGLLVGVGLVALGGALEVSSQPQFCGSCHIMNPYYESWKTSSHSNIACVECHIPPGPGAAIRKKYEALSMVTSYFTGTYGTNPWAEIDDAACLKCHERRLLAGRELFGDVLFDHAAHLSGMRRGKDLRCTSCHSQIVQGSHIAVTESTCILCHFKGQTAGEGIARCTLCHALPDTITAASNGFDHADVARLGMDCTGCHARPAGSDGMVPRERCVTCHNDPARLALYEETDHLHRTHVAEHKVDCLNCHLEIDHVGSPQVKEALPGCETCHTMGHSPQMELYSGIGGRGVAPMPDPMFAAGVRCEGCHIEVPGHQTAVRKASDISCMSCHGPSYRKIYDSWKSGLSERTRALDDQIARTAKALGGDAPEAFADARFNLDLVSRGRGVHNVAYAAALLDRSHDDMNRARDERGLAPLPRPWEGASYASPCLSCHMGIEGQSGRVFDRRFQHAPHVISAGLECLECHVLKTGSAGRGGRGHADLAIDASGCDSCHHGGDAPDCRVCHASIRGGTVESPLGDFDHAFHLDDVGAECSTCHEVSESGSATLNENACADCH